MKKVITADDLAQAREHGWQMGYRQSREDLLEAILNDEVSENIGMGSLDYHEKCAIDGFKEYIKAKYGAKRNVLEAARAIGSILYNMGAKGLDKNIALESAEESILDLIDEQEFSAEQKAEVKRLLKADEAI